MKLLMLFAVLSMSDSFNHAKLVIGRTASHVIWSKSGLDSMATSSSVRPSPTLNLDFESLLSSNADEDHVTCDHYSSLF